MIYPIGSSETVIAAWFAGVIGVLAAIGKAGKWVLERKDRLRKDEVRKQLLKDKDHEIASWRAHSKLMNELNQVLLDSDACRVLLLKTSNGGGVPGPGATVRVTIESEACANMVPSMMDWQARPMDQSYSRMIVRLITERRMVLRPSELPKGSELRNSYEANGVLSSWVFKVAVVKGAFFFLSLNFTKEERLAMTAADVDRISASINRIRSLLGFAYEVYPLSAWPTDSPRS